MAVQAPDHIVPWTRSDLEAQGFAPESIEVAWLIHREGPFHNPRGFASGVVADRLKVSLPKLNQLVKPLVAGGVLPKPDVNGRRCYGYFTFTQITAYELIKQACRSHAPDTISRAKVRAEDRARRLLARERDQATKRRLREFANGPEVAEINQRFKAAVSWHKQLEREAKAKAARKREKDKIWAVIFDMLAEQSMVGPEDIVIQEISNALGWPSKRTRKFLNQAGCHDDLVLYDETTKLLEVSLPDQPSRLRDFRAALMSLETGTERGFELEHLRRQARLQDAELDELTSELRSLEESGDHTLEEELAVAYRTIEALRTRWHKDVLEKVRALALADKLQAQLEKVPTSPADQQIIEMLERVAVAEGDDKFLVWVGRMYRKLCLLERLEVSNSLRYQALIEDRNIAERERDQALAERDEALRERDVAREETRIAGMETKHLAERLVALTADQSTDQPSADI